MSEEKRSVVECHGYSNGEVLNDILQDCAKQGVVVMGAAQVQMSFRAFSAPHLGIAGLNLSVDLAGAGIERCRELLDFLIEWNPNPNDPERKEKEGIIDLRENLEQVINEATEARKTIDVKEVDVSQGALAAQTIDNK